MAEVRQEEVRQEEKEARKEEEGSCPGPAPWGGGTNQSLGKGSPRTTAVARPGQLAPGRLLMQLVTSHGLEGVAGTRRRVVVGNHRTPLPASRRPGVRGHVAVGWRAVGLYYLLSLHAVVRE